MAYAPKLYGSFGPEVTDLPFLGLGLDLELDRLGKESKNTLNCGQLGSQALHNYDYKSMLCRLQADVV